MKSIRRYRVILIIMILLIAQALTLPVFPREVQALDLGNVARRVDIPDRNLHDALSKACGKKHTASHLYPLTNKDLAKLTGTLDLSGKNIKNLEGIQYCINVHSISASDNPLNNFPDMKDMEKLESLHLHSCQLTEIPAALSKIPNLDTLDLANNQIKDTGNLKGCTKLKFLNMSENKISSIPAGLGLSNLLVIELYNNRFSAFPEAVLEYKQLISITLAYNELKSLPDALGKMPNLTDLYIYGNQLSSLPASLGSSSLKTLDAGYNQLTSLPASLFKSKSLESINLSINVLTELPETIANSQCNEIDLRLNYLDISQGSKTLQLINKIPASHKYYKAQLTPIRSLKTVPGKDQIKVTWDPCQDVTNEPKIQAYVSHYEVYLKENNKLSLQGSVQKAAAPSFIDKGLAPGAKRDYSIAVIYEITAGGPSYSSRYFSSISAEIKKEETSTTTTTTTTTTTAPTTTTTTTATTTASSESPATSSWVTGQETSMIDSVTSQRSERTEIIRSDETSPAAHPEEEDRKDNRLIWLVFGAGILTALIAGVLVFLIWKRKSGKKEEG